MNPKAQTEIVGIVIIVLLVTIALLFYVSSATNKELTSAGNKLYDSYSSNEVATSFVQTLLNTYVVECQASYEEVIKDCGRVRSTLQCGTSSSCFLVEDIADTLLNATLDSWDYPYGMHITVTDSLNFSYSRHNCSSNTVGRAAPGVFLVPFYPEPGTARVELGFCS